MKKGHAKVLLIVNLIILAVYLLFTMFATPTADDFTYANKAIAFSPINAVINEYLTWASRYTQVFITSVRYHVTLCSDQFYFTWLILYLIIFFMSIGYFIRVFFTNIITRQQALFATLLIFTGIITNLATLDESIYWEIGAITYLLPSSGLIVLFTYLYKHYASLEGNRQLLYFTILTVLVAGLNQIVIVIILLFIFGIICFKIIDKSFNLKLLLYLIVIVILGAIIINAPGNNNRMSHFANSGNLIITLIGTTTSGSLAVLQSIVNPYILGSLLFFNYFLYKNNNSFKYTETIKAKTFVYIVIYLGILYSIVFAHYWGTGEKPVVRLMTIWYILFCIGLLPLACLLSGQISKIYLFILNYTSKIFNNKLKIDSILLVIIVLSLLGINNFPKAIYDLSYNIPTYLEEKKEFYNAIDFQQDKGRKILEVNSFTTPPILLKTPTDADYGVSRYFGFDSIKITQPK